jgi:hypothetical protein
LLPGANRDRNELRGIPTNHPHRQAQLVIIDGFTGHCP